MSIATATQWQLSLAEFRGVSRRAHAATLPGKLRLPLGQEASAEELRAAALIDDFGVQPHLETVLRLLATAHTHLSVLLSDVAPHAANAGAVTGARRAAIAIGNAEAALVAVHGPASTAAGGDGGSEDRIVVEQLPGSGMDSVSAAVWHLLGEYPVADVIGFRCVLETLQQRLAQCHTPQDLSYQLTQLGCEESQAAALTQALSAARRAEIVARVEVNGITQTSIGAVAVFDGAAGRVVAVPDISTDGIAWTTLSGGTRKRLEQALSQLVSAVPEAEVA